MTLLIGHALELLDFPKLVQMLFFFVHLVLYLVQCSLFLHHVAILNLGAKVFFDDVVFQIFSDVLLVDVVKLILELTNKALNDFVDEESRWLLFKVVFDLRFFNL